MLLLISAWRLHHRLHCLHGERFYHPTQSLEPGEQRLLLLAECEAIRLRQQRKMSLGDSLIAGTALTHGLKLVTCNIADFRWIPALTLIDPLAAP